MESRRKWEYTQYRKQTEGIRPLGYFIKKTPAAQGAGQNGRQCGMERMAWKGRIKPGCKAEYIRRHNEIWPEMVEVLKSAGICNYTIYAAGEELFGYYECEKGVAFAEQAQANSPVVDRWNEYMKDILELEMDPETGAQPKLEPVFRLD